MDALIRFLAGLLPPEGSDPKKMHEYLKRLGLSSCVTAGAVGVLWVIAFGMIPRVFGEGFVTGPQLEAKYKSLDDKVSVVSGQVAASAAEANHRYSSELESRISDTCDKYRKAQGDELQNLYRAAIQNMQADYFKLNGANYPTPGCGAP